MKITIPFKGQPTAEAEVITTVDALAHALAAQLSDAPWEPAEISHAWEPNDFTWRTCHSALLKQGTTWLCVSYNFGGSGRDGGGSFSLNVNRGGRYVLEAYHSGAEWCVSSGDADAIDALRRACAETMARLADV